jgi:hypothetical protein
MIDNASVEAEKARIRAQYEQGQADGYATQAAPLPGFYTGKPLIMLTAYERGYFVGRQLAMEEQAQ